FLLEDGIVTFCPNRHPIPHRGDTDMRKLSEVGLGLSLALLFTWLAFSAKPKAQTSAQEPAHGPVVVELFTSEGCSSCPPADALLRKLQARQSIGGRDYPSRRARGLLESRRLGRSLFFAGMDRAATGL